MRSLIFLILVLMVSVSEGVVLVSEGLISVLDGKVSVLDGKVLVLDIEAETPYCYKLLNNITFFFHLA